MSQINPQVEDNRNEGVYVSFEFTDSDFEGAKGKEIKANLQPNTLKFLRSMHDWIQTIDKPIIIAPSEKKRYELYKRYLENLKNVPVYFMKIYDDEELGEDDY